MNTKDILTWDGMGALLASLSNDEQALFFKGFVSEMKSYPTHYAMEMQMMYINGSLDVKTKEAMRDLFPAMWYDGKADK